MLFVAGGGQSIVKTCAHEPLVFFPNLAKHDGEYRGVWKTATPAKRSKCRAGVLGFNRKSTGCRRIVSLAPLDNLSHWLEANIQQCRLAAGDGAQTALNGLAHFARFFDFFAVAIEGLDQ